MRYPHPRVLPIGLLFLGLLAVLVTCAWQSDDAYITFRTVSNAWAGHGLTWNPGERLQSYTHPLWMLLSLLCYGLFREVYYSTLALSILLTMTAVTLLVRRLRPDPWLASGVLLLLATSGAFVDYATSGLETPLLYLLFVLFVFTAVDPGIAPGKRLSALCLLAAALGLTRLDALLVAFPALFGAAWRVESRREALGRALIGLSPLAAWEVFSLVYYGFLVPNTALAKLNVAIPILALIGQGALYFLDSLRRDPLTLGATLLFGAVALRRGGAPHRLVAVGIGLYLVYILRIGGDFMSGRFFAAPFLAAVALFVATRDFLQFEATSVRRLLPQVAVALLVCFGMLWPETRWRSGIDFGSDIPPTTDIAPAGIADERAYYYPYTGLLPVLVRGGSAARQGPPLPPDPGAIRGALFAKSDEPATLRDTVGFFGYFAGDRKVVVDIWALCDPLLARLPFRPQGEWRIGHYPRRLPQGYFATRASGENRLADPDLAAVWDGLAPILRGPLFTTRRWREIWRFNTGFYARQSGKEDYL